MLGVFADCAGIYNLGITEDGVYDVVGKLGGSSFSVYCDLRNGGWTYIQHRLNGSLNFDRNWADYETGFGDVSGEHWLGLENIVRLCPRNSPTSVLFELYDGDRNEHLTLEQNSFSIGPASDEYRLAVSGTLIAKGNLDSQSFIYNNGQIFATKDKNDLECAKLDHSGWWFKDNKYACTHININGLYGTKNLEMGFVVVKHAYYYKNLLRSTMKVK